MLLMKSKAAENVVGDLLDQLQHRKGDVVAYLNDALIVKRGKSSWEYDSLWSFMP